MKELYYCSGKLYNVVGVEPLFVVLFEDARLICHIEAELYWIIFAEALEMPVAHHLVGCSLVRFVGVDTAWPRAQHILSPVVIPEFVVFPVEFGEGEVGFHGIALNFPRRWALGEVELGRNRGTKQSCER